VRVLAIAPFALRSWRLEVTLVAAQRGSAASSNLRWRIVGPLFELLYRNRTLYWLASTLPFAGQWRTWQRLVIPHLAGRDVLEVGCGIGTLLADMAAAGYTCAAIDRSPQMVAATRDRLRRHHIPPAVASVRQADIRALPFADAAFDSVVSTFPTDYIADPRTITEIARVLRPGGRFVVVLGATLLPSSMHLLPLLGLQALVYGNTQHASGAPDAPDALADPDALVGPERPRDAPFALLLAGAGLRPHVERVRGPFWVALLYIAEKSD
jgi:SAM-dependent methyltransferase